MASIISAGTTSGTALNMAGDTSGVLQLATNGSTTAVTVDASQNVGIGTITPAQKLDVASKVQIDTANAYGKIKIARATDSGVSAMYIQGADNAGAGNALRLVNGSGVASAIDLAQEIKFYINSDTTERMRIDSSGNLLVGATTRTGVSGLFGKLYVEQSANDSAETLYNTGSIPYGLAIGYSATPNGSGSEFLFCRDATAQRMSVKSNGGINNYSANNTNLSDQREKTNIELAGSYLDKVCAIPVKTFNYIDQNMEEDGGLTLGVIAQDVQAVAPELVMESNWASKDEPEKLRLSIYQTDLQYALMKCIQEQQTIINDLKARITALEGAA